MSASKTPLLAAAGVQPEDVPSERPGRQLYSNDYSADFLAFWALYPRRQKKGEAFKAWKQLKLTAAILPEIESALSWQVLQTQWCRDGGEYIPHPATWLRARQWEDEPTDAPARALPAHETKQSRTANDAVSLARELSSQQRVLKADF